MSLIEKIRAKAQADVKTIVLPEGDEKRTVKAAEIIKKEGLAEPVLIGSPDAVAKVAAEQGADISGIKVIDPAASEKSDEYAQALFELRKAKGVTEEDAKKLVSDPMYFAVMMVKLGDADGLVSGAVHTTGDMLRPALQIIKAKPGMSIVSSSFLMECPNKAYGDKLLFEHLSFELPPAGIVGVIGPNGAGKTTLFRLIMGIEQPDSGSIEIGETVKIAYVDQQHRSIDPEKTVYETIAGNSEWVRLGGRDINARAWVSRFNFSGADQEKLCGVLSGGERNRLHLALTLKDEGNVLLLDEPTNDVDVNTIRALEEGLDAFAGCAVVVSHDRWFLDRIATHILAYEGEGKVVFFEGNYQEYEENRKMRLGDTEPKRFKYKKLME